MIKQVIEEIEKLENAGVQELSVSALIEYLKKVDQTSVSQTDLMRLQNDSNLAKYAAESAHNLEMFRSVVETSKSALKTCILINGGASVAVLSFIGNTQNLNSIAKCFLVSSLTAFSIGVLLAAIATSTAYFTQYLYSIDQYKFGLGFHLISVLLVVIAYISFAYGIYAAYHAFLI